MLNIKRTEKKELNTYVFIGKAWINHVSSGKNKGVEYINLTLDDNLDSVELKRDYTLLLWPNNRRPGKNDAHFRVSVLVPTDEDEKNKVTNEKTLSEESSLEKTFSEESSLEKTLYEDNAYTPDF